MAEYAAGLAVCLDVEFREFPAGPFIDPPDARFDVLDPLGVVVAANVPTTIVTSPGRHRGCYQTTGASMLGDWTMRFKATIEGEARVENCEFTLVSAIPVSYGPCDAWEFDQDCCQGLPDDVDEDLVARWQMVSTQLLWAASGRRYGPCPVTIRPCARRCFGGAFPVPYKGSDGAWRNFSACGCRDDCSCVELSEIVLDGPVAGVQAVVIDGVILEPSDYRLDNVGGQWRLVRLDGGFWPDCQDMTAGCDEFGAFCVTYLKGLPVDEAAVAANSELTCELVKSCLPGCTCRLPANVVAKTSRGLSIAFDTSQSWIRALPLVAAWLDSVNPNGLAAASSVFTPDVTPTRAVT